MEDVVRERLEDQIGWYDAHSSRSQRDYKHLKYIEIVAAAAIPVVTGIDVTHVVPATLGALVVLIEAVLHLNQYQKNWLTYRATAEALTSEKYLYLANAQPYAVATDPRALLAARVEGLVSHEHAKWVAREDADTAPTEAATT